MGALLTNQLDPLEQDEFLGRASIDISYLKSGDKLEAGFLHGHGGTRPENRVRQFLRLGRLEVERWSKSGESRKAVQGKQPMLWSGCPGSETRRHVPQVETNERDPGVPSPDGSDVNRASQSCSLRKLSFVFVFQSDVTQIVGYPPSWWFGLVGMRTGPWLFVGG